MKITQKLKNALREAVDHAESQNTFAKKVGIDSGAITRYLNGKTKSIKDDEWEKLKPFLSPHLVIDNSDDIYRDHSTPCTKLCEGMQPWEIEIIKKFKELSTPNKLSINTKIDELRKEELKNVQAEKLPVDKTG
jgi:hypothetical protein